MNRTTSMTRGQDTIPQGKIPPAVIELAERMRSGESVRCPGCLRWVAQSSGLVGALVTPDNPTEVKAYVICRQCIKRASKSRAAYAQHLQRIKSYLFGGE